MGSGVGGERLPLSGLGIAKAIMEHNLRNGINLVSQYSGVGTAEMSAAFIDKSLRRHFGIGCGFIAKAASDSKPSCRAMLKTIRFDGGEGIKHVFGNNEDRLPAEIRSSLRAMLDHAKKPGEVKARMQGEGLAPNKLLLRYVCAAACDLLDTEGILDADATSWCYQCNAFCKTYDIDVNGAILVFLVAGITCKDWSRFVEFGQNTLDPWIPFQVLQSKTFNLSMPFEAL